MSLVEDTTAGPKFSSLWLEYLSSQCFGFLIAHMNTLVIVRGSLENMHPMMVTERLKNMHMKKRVENMQATKRVKNMQMKKRLKYLQATKRLKYLQMKKRLKYLQVTKLSDQCSTRNWFF